MTEENKELLEELKHDRMEEVMRLEADNEAGKIAFNEVVTLLKIDNETRKLDADIELEKAKLDAAAKEAERKNEQDKRAAELEKAKLEAAVKEAELKIAQERRMFWLKVFEIGTAVVIGTFVMPKIKKRDNIEMAHVFTALEKEDYYNGTPYKSLSRNVFTFN